MARGTSVILSWAVVLGSKARVLALLFSCPRCFSGQVCCRLPAVEPTPLIPSFNSSMSTRKKIFSSMRLIRWPRSNHSSCVIGFVHVGTFYISVFFIIRLGPPYIFDERWCRFTKLIEENISTKIIIFFYIKHFHLSTPSIHILFSFGTNIFLHHYLFWKNNNWYYYFMKRKERHVLFLKANK